MTRGIYVPPRQGGRREIPCQSCTSDALNNKYTGGCYDNANGQGNRCYRCATDKLLHCSSIHGPLAIQPTLRLMEALEASGEEDERVPELRDALRNAWGEDEAALKSSKLQSSKRNAEAREPDRSRQRSTSENSHRWQSRSWSPALGARSYRTRSPPRNHSNRAQAGSNRNRPPRGGHRRKERRRQKHEDDEDDEDDEVPPDVAERRARLKQLIVNFADDLVELLVK